MNYLFVVAHPDDEVLGAGATIFKLIKNGDFVTICMLSGSVSARQKRPLDEELACDIDKALKMIGVSHLIKGDFPNIEFNTVPHLKLVQFVEKAIVDSDADIVFTHHPSDLNNDHLHTSLACQAAVRLFQRNHKINKIREFYFMEISSSTDWSLNRSLNQFAPNTYIQIGVEGLAKKIQAISQYRNVMREYPHPRSEEAIRALAIYRGSQSGLQYAEVFECVFRNIE